MIRVLGTFFGVAAFALGFASVSVAQQAPQADTQSVPLASSEPINEIPPLISSEKLAERDVIWDTDISPDGSAMSFFYENGSDLRMAVASTDTLERIKTFNLSEFTRVYSSRWISDDKMILDVGGFKETRRGWYAFSNLLLVYPREGRIELLVENQRSRYAGDVIFVSEDASWALVAQRGDGKFYFPSVYRYELKPGGKATKIQGPIKGVWVWTADKDGVLRMGVGYYNRRYRIYYRPDANSELEQIAKIKPGDDDKFFEALAIISDSDSGYILDEGEDGRVGLRIYDYKTREITETIYENPDWDIESAWLKDGKPIAAFYTDDRRQVVWFDEDYKRDHELLKEALGNREVWVQSRSKDNRMMLAWAGDEADPGVLYLFNRDTKKLREVLQYRPGLDFRLLTKPKPFTYTARDGTDIRAYLTLPKGRVAKDLPLIILPHGGPFGIRDSLRYSDEVQFLANRGYAVIQPNFRGSGGYGTDFYDLGAGQVGRGMQDDLDDAMDWAVGEGIADPDRVCVVGGSYGGYAALWAVLRNPERYRCAASWAGVTDWDRMLRYDRRYLTRKAGKRWEAKIEGDDKDFDLKDVSPYRLAENLSRPVLLAHGTRDSNVPFKQYEQLIDKAEDAPVPLTTLVIEDEGHSFSKPESEQKWYDALEVFLGKHNPSDVNNGSALVAAE